MKSITQKVFSLFLIVSILVPVSALMNVSVVRAEDTEAASVLTTDVSVTTDTVTNLVTNEQTPTDEVVKTPDTTDTTPVNEGEGDEDNDDGGIASDNHVNVCHVTGSQSHPWSAISINQSSLQTHLGHGDFMYNGPVHGNGNPNNSGGQATAWCVNHAPQPMATIVATKIVCDDELDLPNWGTGGANITSSTAQNWVNEHKSCSLKSGWSFEWSQNGVGNPGDNASGGNSGWHTFGTTGENGQVSVQVSTSNGPRIWLREVPQEGYIPFTGTLNPQGPEVSAEFYCNTDVLNYDNWEWIDPLQANQTYNCVAWNVPVQTPPARATVHVEKFVNGVYALGNIFAGTYAFPMFESYGSKDLKGIPTGNYTLNPDNQYRHDSTSITIPGFYSTNEVVNNGENGSRVVSGECVNKHCPADLNYDGEIDKYDLEIVCQKWTPDVKTTKGSECTGEGFPIPGYDTGPYSGDVNDDGVVNVDDLLQIIIHWGHCPFDYHLDGYTTGDSWEQAEAGKPGTTAPQFDELNSDKYVVVWNSVCEAPRPGRNTPPVITLLGANPTQITVGTTYVDAGATATDLEDGDLTSSILVSNFVDTNTIGSYNVNYTVTDSGSLGDFKQRIVNVVAGEPQTPPTPPSGGPSGNPSFTSTGSGSGGGNGAVLGEVLGASTCGKYLNAYIHPTKKNDSYQVTLLQLFLNNKLGAHLPLTGVYDSATQAAVASFQLGNSGEVLKPWADKGLLPSDKTATKYVYKTTQRWINKLMCDSLNIPIPELN